LAKINSPLGSSNVNGPQPRHFSVPDESGAGRPASMGSMGSMGAPQPPANQGPIVFNATDPVAPPASQLPPQQPIQEPQQPVQRPVQTAQPVHHGSYEEAMAHRQQVLGQMQAERDVQGRVDKSAVEVLLGIGRKSVDVPIHSDHGATVFTLTTLKSKERRHVIQALDKFIANRNHDNLHSMRDTVLAYAISGVEGKSLDYILGCVNYPEEERFLVRESFVKELDDNISLYLFSKFEKLDEESRSKYSLESPEAIREVAEAVSKSS